MASSIYTVHTIFRALDKMTQPMAKMTASTKAFSKANKNSMSSIEKMGVALDNYTKQLSSFSSFSKDAASKIGLVFATTALGMTAVLKQSATVESAIVSMTGKLDGFRWKGEGMVKNLERFAVDNPLTINPVLQGANNLMAQGVSENDLMKTMEQLGNLAQGNDDAFESIVRGYGRIFAEDRITREHLDRFITHNVGIYDALAKTLNMNQNELSKHMERGNLGRDDLMRAVEEMTGENGMYYRSMQKHMNTLNGATQQFKGSGSMAMRSVGDTFNPFAKQLVKGGTEYFQELSLAFDRLNGKTYEYNNVIYDTLEKATAAAGNNYTDEDIKVHRTDAFKQMWEAMQRVKEAFSGLLPDINGIMDRLADGTSLFYVFCEALEAVGKGLKTAKWWLELFSEMITSFSSESRKGFFTFFAKIIAFGVVAAPVFVALIGFLGNFLIQIIRLKAAFPKILTTIRSIGTPILSFFKSMIAPILTAFRNLLSSIIRVCIKPFALKILAAFGKISGAKGLVAGVMLRINLLLDTIKNLGKVVASLAKMAKSKLLSLLPKVGQFLLKFLIKPLVFVIAVLAVVVTVIALLARNCDWAKRAVDWMQDKLKKFADWLRSKNNPICDAFAWVVDSISRMIKVFSQGSLKTILITALSILIEAVFGILQKAMTWLAGLVGDLFGLGDVLLGFSDALGAVSGKIKKYAEDSLAEDIVKAEARKNNVNVENNVTVNNSQGINSTVEAYTLEAQPVGF